MSKNSKSFFSSVPVDIPNKSGFDMSHENIGTLKVGTLTPVLCEELLPGDSVSLSHVMQVTLPPMATDFYGQVDLRLEAFFVPNRICWSAWQGFATSPVSSPFNQVSYQIKVLPYATISASATESYLQQWIGPGTLADYLGCKIPADVNEYGATLYIWNLLPYIAYYKIYDDWYRNSHIQNPLFNPAGNSLSSLATLPNVASATASFTYGSSVFYDGTVLGELKQRNWEKDYFTTSHLYPVSGDDIGGARVLTGDASISESNDQDNASFTVSQLRAANVLQRWIERNNIAGTRYVDQIQATFGIRPSDAVFDRPLFLGSSRFGVYNNSVFTQSSNSETSNNPFSSLTASEAASCKGFGKDSLVDKFTASEHGYLMVIASLVPHAYYSTGTRRYLCRRCLSDFANPLLQGLGEQAVYKWELSSYYWPSSNDSSTVESSENTGNSLSTVSTSIFNSFSLDSSSVLQNSTTNVFGYTQQFAEYKYHEDEVHGLLRDGSNLSSFALSRAFNDSDLSLSTEFIEIPTTAMDDVSAVTAAVSEYGAWYDIHFNFKKISTLSEYVIPTLGDLTNTHRERIPNNGTML